MDDNGSCVQYGISQDSVMGILLLNILFNDITNDIVKFTDLLMYIDATTLIIDPKDFEIRIILPVCKLT